jgi:sugar-specific transcriptional regulator TrmB
VEHGVAEPAARVYLAACREGPQTASELARMTALHRVEAYRLIRQLTSEGLLSAVGGRPMRWAALPPESLFERWIQRTRDKLTRLESAKVPVIQEWQDQRLDSNAADPRRFGVLEGPVAIDRFLGQRIGAASREILVTAGTAELSRFLDGGVARSLRSARDRGVAVRVLTEVLASHLPEARHFGSIATVRHALGPITQPSIVIDRAGALWFIGGGAPPAPPDGSPIGIWSTSPEFVRQAREYHRSRWATAVPFEERLVEIEAPSPVPLTLRPAMGNTTLVRLREVALLGLKTTGLREIHLNLPDWIDTVARQAGRQLAQQLEGTTPSEVAHSLAGRKGGPPGSTVTLVKERPLTLRIRGCFACTKDSPEIGRVLCPKLLSTVLESRVGGRWASSSPDPRQHARHGCLFTLTPL